MPSSQQELNLIIKYAPMAMKLFKDPSKIADAVVKTQASIQTALRTDPKSTQGQANTKTAITCANIAQKAKAAFKAAYAAEQLAEKLPLQAAKKVLGSLNTKMFQVAVHEMQLYKSKITAIEQQLQATKAAILSCRAILSKVATAEKNVITAQKLLTQASSVKVPSIPTGTTAQKAKAILAIAKAYGDALKKVATAIKLLQSAEQILQQLQTEVPAAMAKITSSIQKLQQTIAKTL